VPHACKLNNIIGEQKSSQFPEMLPCMKQIDNLHGTGKVLIGIVPDPFGSISDHDLLLCAIPSAVPGFQIAILASSISDS